MPFVIKAFFDSNTGTVSYVVHEAPGTGGAIIDSVLDFDARSGHTSTAGADHIIDYVRDLAIRTEWILETHAHADHLSAAPYLKQQLGGRIAIGEQIRKVQSVFKPVFNLGPDFRLDGSQFDHLFADGETFSIGSLRATALYVPGHTPADMSYLVGDAAFVGDTLFMPDVGTARCDFPGGDAHTLYGSISKLLSLPPETRLFMCHDYPPEGRDAQWETTVAAQRSSNIHVRDGVSEADFVAMRTRRDATLAMPNLILPSIQVNIRAGELPPPEANGIRYLRIPLNTI